MRAWRKNAADWNAPGSDSWEVSKDFVSTVH